MINPITTKKQINGGIKPNSIWEIPARIFCPQYIEALESDVKVKKYVIIKDIWYCDQVSYIFKAVIW